MKDIHFESYRLRAMDSRAVYADDRNMPTDRPAIAIISNSQTPYRLHLHRRIAAEIPQVRLWSVYTHEISNSNWPFETPKEIGPVSFGKGESSNDQGKLTNALKEWRRGGRIIQWIKDHDVRFVVAMGYNDAGRMRIIRWCRKKGIPCFVFGDSNIHGDSVGGIKAIIKKIVVGYVVRQCAGALVCGTLGKAYFAKYGESADRMFFFPYEPDYQLISDLSAEQIEAVRQRFGLAGGRRRIVYSGRLMGLKRVDLLIDAFLAIAQQRLEWDLVVVGDGPLRGELEAKIPAQLRDRVIWTGFINEQNTVTAIYRASDVLVLPSDYEPWAVVINEAAAAGMAIVSSNIVGAAAEMVREGVNGRTFQPGDLNQLTACLLDVTDPSRTEMMKQKSAEVLKDWRQRGDPVEGLRAAMRSAGVIGP
jgi:glycosyltransferase involved in cell wall biosynthesis